VSDGLLIDFEKGMTMKKTSLIFAMAAALSAQEGAPHEIRMRLPGPEPGMMPQGATFQFIGAGAAFEGKLVKGVPYAAEGVTEHTQTLADGTRINRKSSSKMARDGQGRTRHEFTVQALGPFAAEGGQAPTVVSIHDPVAGETILLNDRDKTAHRMKTKQFTGGGPAKAWTERKVSPDGTHAEEREVVISAEHNGKDVLIRRGGVAGGRGAGAIFNRKIDAREEKLGAQTIEGVQAEGTRFTHTIPVGEIGNDRPLQTVSEHWYSNELQAVVLTRTNDPQHGETVYRLTNIRKGEPDAALFQAPAGYTVKEGPGGGPGMMRFDYRIERKK
jgi:hypothetical protein